MLIAIGEAQAAPGRREQLRAAAATIVERTRDDAGCVSYGFYADVCRPEVLVSVELWRDRAALDAHLTHEHTLAFLALVPQLVVGEPTLRFFDADADAVTGDAR